ncbi:unnamed protein product [Lactuca saligna]|uniref:Uncharacterized protein n=1 Tax=Lactuca saligna TaxID=75948 RepID=A0AA35VPA9_LACSI|nr:unnamed protein product [Lactuca saligna]
MQPTLLQVFPSSPSFCLFVPPKEPVNEAVITPAEKETKINIFRQPNIPTPEHIDALIKELQSTARKPPQAIYDTVESPSESDRDESNASLMPKKRTWRDPRLGVLIVEPVQQSVSTVEPAQVQEVGQSPIIEPTQVQEDVQANEETFSLGCYSDPLPPEHDVVSLKLAKLLAFQDSIPQSKEKEICICSGQGIDEGSAQTIFELKQEITNLKQESIKKELLIGSLDVRVLELEKEKGKHISDLQENLGGLIALYYDLKDKLIGKFGNEFKTSSFDHGKAPESSERVTISPAPHVNIDQYLSFGHATAEERREKHKKISALKKNKMLLMKNSD